MSDGTSNRIAQELRDIYDENSPTPGMGFCITAADEIDRLERERQSVWAELQRVTDMLEAKAPPEARESYLSGWVIEGAWSPFDRPEYWAGSSIWSADAYKALRFATRESAQQAADLMCAGENVRIACHEFAEE